MPVASGDSLQSDPTRTAAAAFKYLVGAAALFIAGCSAFFSVNGLGLLFVGSAVAVMVMAASLEVGKLVAASFLYRYWTHISKSLRVYLTLAVLILIGITSLGNYGYLARAYEQTNSQIALLEEQIQGVQREIDDTQHQIDGSRAQIGKVSDVDRQDIEKLQQRIPQANQSLDQAIVRIEGHRKSAREKHDRDLDLVNNRMKETAAVLKQAMDSEDVALQRANERQAVLDRAVDAYTRQGGPGFLKPDGVRQGQQLREEQKADRTKITAEIAEHQKTQDKLRTDHAGTIATIRQEAAALEDQYKKEISAVDIEEQAARKANADAVADAESQLKQLQSRGQTTSKAGDNQIESLYQRIRTGNDEIRRLKEQIAATDIGSYRFAARAFNAGADDVVKWLILVLVLVFDPLAVALTVGFNVALMRDRRPKVIPAADPEPVACDTVSSEGPADPASPLLKPRGRKFAFAGAALVCVVGLGIAGTWLGVKSMRQQARTSHAAVIPGDSFAVVTFRPSQLQHSEVEKKLVGLLGDTADLSVKNALTELLAGGFDPAADVYGFVKYPAGPAKNAADHPVLVCGLVVRVADERTAEAGLSRFCDALSASLGKSQTTSGGTARSRSMVKFGRGRYLDPEGSFLTFALTDREAIVLLEVEGDPQHPTIENEIRLCLANQPGATQGHGAAPAKLSPRAIGGAGAISVWFDAGRCFAQMNKNAAAQARYAQLQRHLGFDLLLTLKTGESGKFELVGDYVYAADRFRAGGGASARDTIARLGPADSAGIPGRLMDRCAAIVDFDGLNETLKSLLGTPQNGANAAQVVVEKTIASDREGRFVLTAQYDAPSASPRVAAFGSAAK